MRLITGRESESDTEKESARERERATGLSG